MVSFGRPNLCFHLLNHCASITETQPYVLENCQPGPPAAYASDMAKADRLWALSEELVGEKFDLKALSSG